MKKKKDKNTKTKVEFELEEDAEQIFLNDVDQHKLMEIKEVDLYYQKVKKTSKKKKTSVQSLSLDLHGYTRQEAIHVVREQILSWIDSSQKSLSLVIITGKGLHSSDGKGVLNREVYDFVRDSYTRYIKVIDDPPYELKLFGAPLRGYFRVVLEKK